MPKEASQGALLKSTFANLVKSSSPDGTDFLTGGKRTRRSLVRKLMRGPGGLEEICDAFRKET